MCVACADDERLIERCRNLSFDDLRRIYLFEGLEDGVLSEVKAHLDFVDLDDGDWLFTQGDDARQFFHVLDGYLVLFRCTEDGEEVVMAILGAGETCSEDLIFLESPRHPLSARAVGSCSLLAFDRERFRVHLERSTSLCLKLMGTLHRRECWLMDEVERLALRSATQRFLAYLLEQAGEGPGPRRVPADVPKGLLASRLAIKPETLSRLIARLKAASLICEDGKSWILPEPAALRGELGCLLCGLRKWGCPGPRLHRV